MSLEDGNTPEKSEIPQPVREVIEKYLTYPTVERRHRGLRIHNALKNADTVKYASALLTAGEREPGGMKYVSDTADNLRAAAEEMASKLKLPLSQWAKDSSWAMRDLGKQYYSYLHQDEPSDIEKEKRIDPFDETAQGNLVLWDVVNRGLAVEARRAFYDKRPAANLWREAIKSDSAYEEALKILEDKKEKNHGHLSFNELTHLGAILYNIAESRNSSETQSANEAEQTTTQGSDLEAQREEETSITHIENAPSIVPSDGAGVITEEKLIDLMNVPDKEKNKENANQKTLEEATPEAMRQHVVHHMDTIASELRRSFEGLGNTNATASEETSNSEKENSDHKEKKPEDDKKSSGHEKSDHKHNKDGHDDDHHEDDLEPFTPTWRGIGKAAAHSLWVLPATVGLVGLYESYKLFSQSLKNMFSVAWAWLKYPSFVALNSNEGLGKVEDVNNEGTKAKGGDDHDDHGGNKKKKAAGGHEKAKKKDDHGHDAHGGGHDAHGADHGKKKDDHGGGGGHH